MKQRHVKYEAEMLYMRGRSYVSSFEIQQLERDLTKSLYTRVPFFTSLECVAGIQFTLPNNRQPLNTTPFLHPTSSSVETLKRTNGPARFNGLIHNAG
jgi:hypothetical protein